MLTSAQIALIKEMSKKGWSRQEIMIAVLLGELLNRDPRIVAVQLSQIDREVTLSLMDDKIS